VATCINCQITPVSYIEISDWFVCCIIPFSIVSFFVCFCLFIVYINFYSTLIYPVLPLIFLYLRLSRCNKVYLLTGICTQISTEIINAKNCLDVKNSIISYLHIQSEWPTWSTWPAAQTSLYEQLLHLAALAGWRHPAAYRSMHSICELYIY